MQTFLPARVTFELPFSDDLFLNDKETKLIIQTCQTTRACHILPLVIYHQ